MKKEYTTPKLETIKINSEDPTAAFEAGNINSSNVILKADSSATNIISY